MTNTEQYVIGGMLAHWGSYTEKCVKALSIVRHEYMSTNDGINTVVAISEVLRDGMTPDMISVESKLIGKRNETYGDWFTFLAEITKNSAGISNIINYSYAIKSDYDAKMANLTLSNAIAILNDHSQPKARERIKSALECVSRISIEDEEYKSSYTMIEGLNQLLDYMERKNGEQAGLSTGFVNLDNFLGRLQSGETYVVAGSPGSGKTTLAINFMLDAILRDKRVLMYSLEMPQVQIMNKIISAQSGVYSSLIRTGDLDNDAHLNFGNAYNQLANKKLIIDEGIGLTAESIDITTKKHEFTLGGIDLIVIDYIQLLSAKGESETVKTSEAARAAKMLSKKYSCPVVILSQLVKNIVGRPKKADLKQSGQIEQDATAIMLLYKDPDDLSANPTVELEIAKNRWGSTGMSYFDAHFANNRFVEVAEPKYIEPSKKESSRFISSAELRGQ